MSVPPEAIGPYRILGVLGEGGMGVVYLAEQTEPLRREVALKILKAGMDTEQVVARFEAERQSLAVMEHPGIARVFDAGSTEFGRPYFVMERVDGVPLTSWCDERRLSIRDRVALFTDVCRAVQHAHQKGVIHRDLKPSNVLVHSGDGGEPQVKIIDFGIARAVEYDADATRLTQLEQSIGTPAYMSPEQAGASDLDVDTRTDIYSLGVLLYELLTGSLPFDPAAYRGWAFLANHLQNDPPRPSHRLRERDDAPALARARGLGPEPHRRALSVDLDWIVLRAMEKDRERRYETANGLAADLERYLESQPVVARPPSAGYRVQKFVKRHWAGVAAAVVFVFLLGGFGTTMAVQAQRLAAARDLADTRRTQAEGLVDFMLGDLRAKLEPIGRLEILDEVGEQAMSYFAALPSSEFTDTELLSRSRALDQIGQVRLNEGRADAAVTLFGESLRLARELSERAPNDTDRLFQLSQSHFWVGYAAWLDGDLEGAEAPFLAYLDAAERLVALDPDDLDYRMELGYAHSNLGSVREARGDLEGAARAFERTLDVKAALVRRDSTSVDWIGELAETHNTLAVVHRKMGRYSDALAGHARELALKDRVLELEPRHAYWRFRRAMALNLMAPVQQATGDPEGAAVSAHEAVFVLDSLTNHDPDNTGWRRNLATAELTLGTLLLTLGERDGAMQALESSRMNLEALVRTDSSSTDWRVQLGVTLSATARAHLAGHDPIAAIKDAERAAALIGDGDASDSGALGLHRAGNLLVLGRAGLKARQGDAEDPVRTAVAWLEDAAAGGMRAELEPLLLEGYALLGRHDEARPLLRSLRDRGWADPAVLEILREQGLEPGTARR